MKKAIILLATIVAYSQTNPQFTTPAPAGVTSVGASVVGNNGIATYCYWVIANYPAGSITPRQPVCVNDAPGTTTSSNYVKISWNSVTNVSNYTVVRTLDRNFPTTGLCSSCVVVAGTTNLTVNNDNTSLTNLTSPVVAIQPVNANWNVDNVNYSAPRSFITPGIDPSSIIGGLGAGTFSQAVVAQTSVTITAATHGITSTNIFGFATDISGVINFPTVTVNQSTRDVSVAFGSSFTGKIILIGSAALTQNGWIDNGTTVSTTRNVSIIGTVSVNSTVLVRGVPGADITGATSSHVALQAAIDGAAAAGGGTIAVSSGSTFKLTTQVFLKAGVKLRGDGMTTINCVSLDHCLFIDVADAEVSGLIITGLSSGTGVANCIEIGASAVRAVITRNKLTGCASASTGTNAAIYNLANDTEISYTEITASGPPSLATPPNGVDFLNLNNVTNRLQFIHNRIHDSNTLISVMLFDVHDSLIAWNDVDQNNRYDSSLVGGTFGAHGYGIASYLTQALGSSDRNRFIGNAVYNTAGASLYLAQGQHSIVSGNILKTCDQQVPDSTIPGGCIVDSLGTGTVINGNKIFSSTTNGIVISGTTGDSLTGNTILGVTTYDIKLGGNETGASITGNTATGGSRCISAAAAPLSVTISANTLQGCITAIVVAGSHLNVGVSDNVIKTVTTGIQSLTGNVTKVTGNQITGATGFAMDLESHHGIASGNIMTANGSPAVGLYGSEWLFANNIMHNNAGYHVDARGSTNVSVIDNDLGGNGNGFLTDGTEVNFSRRNNRLVAGGPFVTPLIDHTASYTLQPSDSNTTHTNSAASGAVVLTLPTPIVDETYTVIVQAAQTLTVTATGSAKIRNAGTLGGTNGTASASTIGNVITLKAVSTSEWDVISIVGTWSIT